MSGYKGAADSYRALATAADRAADQAEYLAKILGRNPETGHSRCCAKCSRRPFNVVDCGYNWTGCPNGCHR